MNAIVFGQFPYNWEGDLLVLGLNGGLLLTVICLLLTALPFFDVPLLRKSVLSFRFSLKSLFGLHAITIFVVVWLNSVGWTPKSTTEFAWAMICVPISYALVSLFWIVLREIFGAQNESAHPHRPSSKNIEIPNTMPIRPQDKPGDLTDFLKAAETMEFPRIDENIPMGGPPTAPSTNLSNQGDSSSDVAAPAKDRKSKGIGRPHWTFRPASFSNIRCPWQAR
jgi:hypothetical protein